MDIDMLGRVSNAVENLEQIVRVCATVEVDADGVVFDPCEAKSSCQVNARNHGHHSLEVALETNRYPE